MFRELSYGFFGGAGWLGSPDVSSRIVLDSEIRTRMSRNSTFESLGLY